MDRMGNLGEESDIFRCLKERENNPFCSEKQTPNLRDVDWYRIEATGRAKLVHQFSEDEKRLCDFIRQNGAPQESSNTPNLADPDYFPLTPFAVTFM